MASFQPSREEISLKLSEVLDDIGVNNEMIQKRRQSANFRESVYGVHGLIDDMGVTNYLFGSQSEGTTTVGMNSDEDMLTTDDDFIVIDDLINWQIGTINLLMIRDETTTPGYCLLQLLRDDIPLTSSSVPNNAFYKDDKGRVLIKHTMHANYEDLRAFDNINAKIHGPATSVNMEGIKEMDCVLALYCSKWPAEAREWLTRGNEDGWPDASLKLQCETSGCFLVPVDSKKSGLVGAEVEWRISTALAERYLMFSLNNTHLKCYIIVKLLIKTHDVFRDVISSYMCKIALLHCVEKTRIDFWQHSNLIVCLNRLLSELYNCIANLNCPHFIIHENNLMAGRISPSQQQKLLETLEKFIKSEGKMLQGIHIDKLGDMLRHKLFNVPEVKYFNLKSMIEMQVKMSGVLFYNAAVVVVECFNKTLIKHNDSGHEALIQNLKLEYKTIRCLYPLFDIAKRKAARHLTSLMRTTIGTLMASYTFSTQGPMTSYSFLNQSVFGKNTTLEWLESGLNSDVSSSMLKLATVYYSSGNMNATLDLLTHVDQMYDRNVVMPVCGCRHAWWYTKDRFNVAAANRQVIKLRRIISYCVCFINQEIHIVPSELRQEFFRSSQEELLKRISQKDDWMNLAVIDSLPYLYFLQYKTYNALGQNDEKQNAFNKLKNVINEEPERLSHTETVYNLLGQCMEQENRLNDALQYYERSLQIRSEHNAANFHISRWNMFGQMLRRRTWI